VKRQEISYLVLFAAVVLTLATRETSAQDFHVTPHELLPEQKIVVESKDAPQWKIVWDAARKSALQGDFVGAVRSYKALLVMKDNLQEARWELAKLMIHLKRWEEAAELLEHLLGAESDNLLFINSLGKVMLEIEQHERAADLFKRVYEVDPSDQTALAGLVEALSKLDKKKEALPYLEQLSLQEPTNRGIRRYLAFLYYDAGNYENARVHFVILARNEDAEREVLYKTAKTHETLGMEVQAALYWERLLVRETRNIEAHKYLAGYYEKKGELDKALFHLRVVLDSRPEDTPSFARIGETYEKKGEYEKALLFYEKYLEKYPSDTDILRRVVTVNAALGRKKQTLTSLDQYFTPEDSGKKEKLQEAIRQYAAKGRYLEALPLYKKLLELSPEDPDILASLAHDLLAIGENEDKLLIVQRLSEIAPDNLAVYRAMAELLRKLEREEELLAVLSRILEIDPEDNRTRQELAVKYLQRGELEKSRGYFAELPDSSCMNVECLENRALLREKLDRPEHALRDYETILQEQPDRSDVRLKTIYLAADMGLLDTAVYHAGYLQNIVSGRESLELKVLLADVYKEAGYLNKAMDRYRQAIEETEMQRETDVFFLRIRSWLGIADSYKDLGLVYESEQTLRTALAVEEIHQPILTALLRLSLETGNLEKAEIWLQALEQVMDTGPPGNTWSTYTTSKRLLFQAEVHAAVGDYSLALAQLEKAMKLEVQQGEWDNYFFHGAPDYHVRLQMAEYLMMAGDMEAAEKLLEGLKSEYGARPELFVLLEQTFRPFPPGDKKKSLENEIRIYADEDAGRQLVLAEKYRKYGDPGKQFVMAEQAAAHLPDSLAAKRLLVDAMIARGEYAAALEELQQFEISYPENTWLLLLKFQLLAKIGNYQEALAAADVILVEDPQRRDVLLLKVRILWELNRWKESAALYDSVLQVSVEDTLEEKFQELALMIKSAQTKKSWWNVITFSESEPLSLAEVVLSAQHAVDFSASSQAVNAAAASYYASYRWQQRFEQELAVRRAVIRREYYHAAYLLEKVLEEYGSNDFLLYDLGGLYSKLDRLSDEARIYSVLEMRNADFPGLADAVQRNSLKRRPHKFVSYAMHEDDGWDGYKAVKQKAITGGGWYYQSTAKKWGIDLSRNDYESTDVAGQNVSSLRTMATFDMQISQAFDISLAGGMEDLSNGYGNNFLYSTMFTGKLADDMRAVLSIKQDVTPDTVASLTRRILRKDFKFELMFDLFPSLLLGGHYDFIDFSDDNWINNYTIWASYIFLPEPTLLKFSYNYDFYNAREGQKPGVPTDDGFALEDHPYWSPVNYWITKFSFYFKHQLSNDALARGIPSYYTIEYSLGYDAEDNDLHELKGSLNIELAKRYILSASYGFVDMDVLQQKEALFSVTYRW
jgi:tetratricopeptide (TPR) repeat protein